jgi:hypothetical protein
VARLLSPLPSLLLWYWYWIIGRCGEDIAVSSKIQDGESHWPLAELRWRKVVTGEIPGTRAVTYTRILEQLWQGEYGNQEWRAVPDAEDEE